MGLLHRLRKGREATSLVEQAERLIAGAEANLAAGGRLADQHDAAVRAFALLEQARTAGYGDHAHLNLRRAQALYLGGQAADGLESAYEAAAARPYDVDSRVVHGQVRLALGHLPEAEHEFESVLEEFGGDHDASTGLRAVRLAQGEPPLVDDVTLREDWQAAARVLVTAWLAAGVVQERLAELDRFGAPEDAVALIRSAIRRQGEDQAS